MGAESHYHVAHGLAGYGPDASDTDGFPTFESLGEALDYARDELRDDVDMSHQDAHSLAEDGRFEDAWHAIERMESLELLRANLDPARASAPLYEDNPAAYAELQRSQLAEFPVDISHNSRLYVWECSETECHEEV